jgi:hypothetical protein
MFGYNSVAVRIHSVYVSSKVELIMLPELILYLKLETVASHSIINFYTQIFCSTHFKTNISKHKSLILQFNFGQNQLCQNQIFLWRNQTYTKTNSKSC